MWAIAGSMHGAIGRPSRSRQRHFFICLQAVSTTTAAERWSGDLEEADCDLKVAYVLNSYPMPSHSFIRREIQALERLGIPIHRFAMRGDRAALVDPSDLEEHDRTEYVLAGGAPPLLVASLRQFLHAPLATLKALGHAIALGYASGHSFLRYFVYWLEACYLAGRCRQLGITHAHAHFGTNAAATAMLARCMGGPTYSFTVHGPEEFDAPQALSLGRKIEHAAFTVAVSAFGRSQLYRWADYAHWDRIQIVHCGVNPAVFEAPQPIPTPGVRLVSIGRFVEQKGQLLLLDAFAEAALRDQSLHLVLIGDGEMRVEIEARIARHQLEGRVTLTGWLDQHRIREELAAATALVLPSFAEGLPVVIMEAMAAARPVLATYIAGIPELVIDGTNGWLTPAGDTPALTEALLALAATPPEQCFAMGLAARERVMARHDVDREAAKLLTHFLRASNQSTDTVSQPAALPKTTQQQATPDTL